MSASSPPESPRSGIIAIDKPAGWTSFDVVARVRRLVGQKRVGHAGTLDPSATGVLPVCIGQATRVVEYLGDSGKAYRATIAFGVETDTYDAEGAVIATREVPDTLDRAVIAALLPAFIGDIQQVPPRFSALKRDGKRMYDLARAGVEFTPEPRTVRIISLTIIDWQPPLLTLDVECGKGTYIRSLAHDLGASFGTGASLAALVRTRVGAFTHNMCVTLDQLAAHLVAGTWDEFVYAPDEAVLSLDAAIFAAEHELRINQGKMLALPATEGSPATVLRAYSTDGRFLALLERTSTVDWHPAKVFLNL